MTLYLPIQLTRREEAKSWSLQPLHMGDRLDDLYLKRASDNMAVAEHQSVSPDSAPNGILCERDRTQTAKTWAHGCLFLSSLALKPLITLTLRLSSSWSSTESRLARA